MFREAVAGMGEACMAFDTPVTGGNVSFYNESPEGAVYPTPVVGMVGLIEDLSHITSADFKEEGDLIYLIGETGLDIGGSEFLKEYYGKVGGDCPQLDLEKERHMQQSMLQAIRKGWIKSAHDVSDGGLAVALAESCIISKKNPLGAVIELPASKMRPEWLLFSETQSRVVISLSLQNRKKVENFFGKQNVILKYLGKVGGVRLIIGNWINLPLQKLRDIYFQTLRQKMES
jgi:phosphoribosylformylglycinamidine synthase